MQIYVSMSMNLLLKSATQVYTLQEYSITCCDAHGIYILSVQIQHRMKTEVVCTVTVSLPSTTVTCPTVPQT